MKHKKCYMDICIYVNMLYVYVLSTRVKHVLDRNISVVSSWLVQRCIVSARVRRVKLGLLALHFSGRDGFDRPGWV